MGLLYFGMRGGYILEFIISRGVGGCPIPGCIISRSVGGDPIPVFLSRGVDGVCFISRGVQ